MASQESTPRVYEIRVRGQLSDGMVDLLGATRPDESDTSILIEAPDRAALHSTITRLEEFALELISVTRRNDD